MRSLRFRDDNGLFAVLGHRRAAHLVALGLDALQHRGRAHAGLAVADGDMFRRQRGDGEASDVFDARVLDTLRGHVAVGQVYGHRSRRFGSGASGDGDLRPVVGRYRSGALAVALAGRLTNGVVLREALMAKGHLFQGTSDAEVVARIVAESGKGTFVNRLVDALWQVRGPFALVVATEGRVVAVRDPYGVKPLVLGRLEGASLVASDTASVRYIGGELVREVDPGEMVVLDASGVTSVRPFRKRPLARCALEPVQLAAPTSLVFGAAVHDVRVALGGCLARERPVAGVDAVVALPGDEDDDAVALGYARTSGCTYEVGLVRQGRRATWDPPRGLTAAAVQTELVAVPSAVAGRKIVVVVDGVGTGQRLRDAAACLLNAGAAEVHVRVACPPATLACQYGVSSPVTEQLLMQRYGTEERVAEAVGVRSLAYLSVASLREVLGDADGEASTWCMACLTGKYPLPPEVPADQLGLFDGA